METEEQMAMVKVDAEDPVTSESSPFVADNRAVVSTDDVFEQLFRHRTWKYSVLLATLMLSWLSGPPVIFLTAFAGLFTVKLTFAALPNSPNH